MASTLRMETGFVRYFWPAPANALAACSVVAQKSHDLLLIEAMSPGRGSIHAVLTWSKK